MSTLAEDQQNTHQDHLPLPSNIGKIEVSDPAEYEYISQPWELMVTPLDRNTFGFHQTFLMTPSIILAKESFNSTHQLHGLTPDNMLGFTIPLKLGRKSLYWNAPMNPHVLPASIPGGLDVVIDAGQVHIIVLIEISLLERMLTKEQTTALKNAASKRQLPIAKYALDSFTQWLLNLLSHAQQHADMLQHASVLRSVEEDILQQLLRVVRLPVQIPARDSRQKRREGFELALEHLREADLSSLSVPELCNKTSVSQRTLEYAFQEQFSMTPLSFIRKLRLHAVRRTLSSSHFSDISISDAAYQQGIYDMGRFALIYKNHFGELPSQTLLKPPFDSISPFSLVLNNVY